MDRDNRRRVTVAVRPPSPPMRWPSLYHGQGTATPSRSVSVGPFLDNKSITQPLIAKERTQVGTTASPVQPTSSILQNLIKERRAFGQSQDTVQKDHGEGGSRTASQFQPQEDTPSEEPRRLLNTLSTGLRNPRQMGLRETDEYVSKITKSNFDLKLQLWHREQQVEGLKKKVDRMEELEKQAERMNELENELTDLRNAAKENQRLKQLNNDLRRELEKRDQAVTEAVDLICQLETEVEAGRATSDGNANAITTAKVKPQITVDIPERKSSKLATTTFYTHDAGSRHLERPPSFQREDNKSTATSHGVHNNNSHAALSRTESFLSDVISYPLSPRHSVLDALSECSELPPSSMIIDRFNNPVRESFFGLHSSGFHETGNNDARVERWIRSREDVFLQNLSKQSNRHSLETSKTPRNLGAESDIHVNKGFKSRHQRPERDTKTVYGGTQLPPTPDTMSSEQETATNQSNDGVGAVKGHPDETSLLVLRREPGRPRSAGVISTTRRGSVETTLSDNTHVRVSIEIDDVPRASHRATRLILDKEGAQNLTLDIERRGSTSSALTTIESDYSRPTISLHFLEPEHRSFNENGIEQVQRRPFTSPTSTLPSSDCYPRRVDTLSHRLETEDWLEAARLGPLSQSTLTPDLKIDNTGLGITHDSPTDPSPLPRKRIPGRVLFCGRRQKSKADAAAEGPDQRRTRWFRPPFFRRPRHVAPAAPVEDGGAPAPVVRKTRCGCITV